MEYFIRLDKDFPLNEILEIQERLNSYACVVPSYIPDSENLLDLAEINLLQKIYNLDLVFFVDRNIASRMAQIARDGRPHRQDYPATVTMNVMAFAQSVDIDIELGLAFHELAHSQGNLQALEELAWFRTADQAAARQWIDLAQNKVERVELGEKAQVDPIDLTFPLSRWIRNYIVMLKIAELSLSGGRALQSIMTLLNWMIEDFILAGPAFLYAAKLFGPIGKKRRMLKDLRAPDRDSAIKGIQNAAWDVTYISEFGRKMHSQERDDKRYILVTADKALSEVSSMIFHGPHETDDYPSLEQSLAKWWPQADAKKIADQYFRCVADVSHGRNVGADLKGDPLAAKMVAGEESIRNWSR